MVAVNDRVGFVDVLHCDVILEARMEVLFMSCFRVSKCAFDAMCGSVSCVGCVVVDVVVVVVVVNLAGGNRMAIGIGGIGVLGVEGVSMTFEEMLFQVRSAPCCSHIATCFKPQRFAQ